MRHQAISFILIIELSLAACGGGAHPNVPSGAEKIEGADVRSLSHDELMAVLKDCHAYGASDDPRVKYTIDYCSAAQSAHAMEGYATPGVATVDPTLNKMH